MENLSASFLGPKNLKLSNKWELSKQVNGNEKSLYEKKLKKNSGFKQDNRKNLSQQSLISEKPDSCSKDHVVLNQSERASFWKNDAAPPKFPYIEKKKLQDKLIQSKSQYFQSLREEIQGLDYDNDEFIKNDKLSIQELENWFYEKKVSKINQAKLINKKEEGMFLFNQSNKFYRVKSPKIPLNLIKIVDNNIHNATFESDFKTNDLNQTQLHKVNSFSTLKNISPVLDKIMQKSINSEDYMKNNFNKNILDDIVSKKIKESCDFQTNASIDGLAKTLTQETINNFQVFKNLFQHNSQNSTINFEKLAFLLKNRHVAPTNIFDFQLEFKKISTSKQRAEILNQERHLLSWYNEIVGEIKSRKSTIFQISQHISMKKDLIRKQKIYLKDGVKRISVEEESIINDSYLDGFEMKSKKIMQNKLRLNDYMRLNELALKKQQLESKITDYIAKATEELATSNVEMEKNQHDLEELKTNKHVLRSRLKTVYISMLNLPSEILVRNPTDVIQNIWSIKEEVSKDCFPSFLDMDNIIFLIEYSKLEQELKKLSKANEKKFKKNNELSNILNSHQNYILEPDNKNNLNSLMVSPISSQTKANKNQFNTIQKNNIQLSAFNLLSTGETTVQQQQSLNDVRKRINNLKASNLQAFKLITSKDLKTKTITSCWQPVTFSNKNNNKIDNSRNDGPQQPPPTEDMISVVSNKKQKSIFQVSKKMDRLKKQEIQRLIKNWSQNLHEENHLFNIKGVLTYLIGKDAAELELEQFGNLKQIVNAQAPKF